MIRGSISPSSVLKDTREIPSRSGPNRFRLLMSDGLRSWSCEYDTKEQAINLGNNLLTLHIYCMAQRDFVL